MSTKCDYLKLHNRLRLYFEWKDETLKLEMSDKDWISNDDFTITLSKAECEDLIQGLKKALENNDISKRYSLNN